MLYSLTKRHTFFLSAFLGILGFLILAAGANAAPLNFATAESISLSSPATTLTNDTPLYNIRVIGNLLYEGGVFVTSAPGTTVDQADFENNVSLSGYGTTATFPKLVQSNIQESYPFTVQSAVSSTVAYLSTGNTTISEKLTIGTSTVLGDAFDVVNTSGTTALSVLSSSTANNLFEVDSSNSTAVFSVSSSSVVNDAGIEQLSGLSSVSIAVPSGPLVAGSCNSATTSISTVFTTSTAVAFPMFQTDPGSAYIPKAIITAPGNTGR